MLDDGRWHCPTPDFWTYRVPLRVLGTDAGRRGVVARYASDRWAFIGPVPLDAVARKALAAAGRVDALIVPTAFHNTFVPEACAAFPDAAVYLTRGARETGLPAKRVRRLPADLPTELCEVLSPFPIASMRVGHEIAFFHRPSGSLVLADLCMHFPDPADGLWTPLFRRMFGWTPGPRVPLLMRRVLRDRRAARASLEPLLGQGLQRIVMAHGVPIEHDADAVLRELVRQIG